MILVFAGVLVLLRVFYLFAEAYFERDWPRATWRGLITALFLFLLCASAFGQAVREDIPLQTYGPNVPTAGGPQPQALWIANATVYLCSHPSASLAACQGSLITTYTDATQTTPCSGGQLVQLPGTTCTAKSGTAGNVGFWYAGGLIDYWVVSPYGTYGPFSINTAVPGSAGNPAPPAFAVNFANSSVSAFQGDANILINPTLHSFTSPITNSVYTTTSLYSAGSTTGGLQEVYNACVAAASKTCYIQLLPYTAAAAGTLTTGQVPVVIDYLGPTTCTNATGYCLSVDMTTSPRGILTVRNLKMDGTGSTGGGLQLISGQSVIFQGEIDNFQSDNTFPLYLNFIEDSQITVKMEQNRNGIWADNATNNDEFLAWIGDNVGADGVAITVNGGSGGDRFSGLVQSNHGTYTVVLGGVTTASPTSGTAANVVFDNMHFENNGDGTSFSRLVKANSSQTPAVFVLNTEFRNCIVNGGNSGGGLGGAAGDVFTSPYASATDFIQFINGITENYASLTDSTFTSFQPVQLINNNFQIADTYNTIANNLNTNQPALFQAVNVVNPALPSSIAGGLAVGGNVSGNSLYNNAAGVLGETANLIKYSQFDSGSLGSTWTQLCPGTPQTLTANTTDVTDPLGGNTALKVVQGATFGCSGVSGQAQAISPHLTDGNTYTFSFWARSTVAGVNIFAYTTAPINPTFNLTTSWQLYTATYIPNSTNDGGISINVNTSSPSSTYYIWGAQLEPGAGRGYYNHTTSAPVPSSTGLLVNSIVDTALAPGTSPICPNGTGGALTTSGCASAAFQVNGTPLTSASTVNFQAGTNITLTNPSAGNILVTASATAATAWSSITGGTLAGQALIFGSGASLEYGTGTIDANLVNGAAVPTSKTFVGTNSSGQIVDASSANAATATALASSPTNCSAGQAPRGINASGTAQNCTAYALEICHGTVVMNVTTVPTGSIFHNTATCTGAAVGDNVMVDFQGTDPDGKTGYDASIGFTLTLVKKVSATNTIDVEQVNSTNNPSAITPGAVTLAYRVVR